MKTLVIIELLVGSLNSFRYSFIYVSGFSFQLCQGFVLGRLLPCCWYLWSGLHSIANTIFG